MFGSQELLIPMRMPSKKLARITGNTIGVDWDKIDIDEFRAGLKVELEHGSKLGSKTNVTKDDLVTTGRIALAHLEEIPDYYSRLKDMESQARKENQLKEGEVTDLAAFRKQKQDDEDYYNIVIVSHNGKYVFDVGEVVIAELTHRDQADALADGNLDAAVRRGAEVLPISTTLFEKYRKWQKE